ncbi:MAG: hypothetical protein AB8H80_01950 [Planctomycetota bacterium]
MSAPLLPLVALAALSCPIVGQDPRGETLVPTLELAQLGAVLDVQLLHPTQAFVGVVVGSLSPTQTHFLTGLPPLLTDGVVLGLGVGNLGSGFELTLPLPAQTLGVDVYLQGVTITEVIEATELSVVRV